MANQGGRDWDALNDSLVSRARELLPQWLPGGKWLKGEIYACSNLQGGSGQSLKVNTRRGDWRDWSQEHVGGDFVALYAEIHHIKMGEAFDELANGDYRMPVGAIPTPNTRRKEQNAPPPLERPPQPLHDQSSFYSWRLKRQADAWWEYRDLGGVLYYTMRFNATEEGGKKEFSWLRWIEDKWVERAPPAPRPLYNTHLALGDGEKRILLVEGEKSADRAQEILGKSFIVMTWPGGSEATPYADLSVLEGRHVTLWPDADMAGLRAMDALSKRLAGHAASIRMIDVQSVMLPLGWDIADAVADGWGAGKISEFAKPLTLNDYAPSELQAVAPEQTPVAVLDQPPEDDVPFYDGEDVPRETTLEVAPRVEIDRWSGVEIAQHLGLMMTRSGPAANLPNVGKLLRGLNVDVWYDEFTGTLIHGHGATWGSEDTTEITIKISTVAGINTLRSNVVEEAIAHYVYRDRRRHIAREWLSGLAWDGVERLPTLLADGWGADQNDYTAAVGRCWFVSMAARVMKPGSKVDTMPVFEGAQGKRKSSALQILAIRPEWFLEATDAVTNKDFFQKMLGKLIVEVPEMASFQGRDALKVKAMLTIQSDSYRAPYARSPKMHPRTAVFAGTNNRDDWHDDPTGARRYWAVKCGSISHAYLHETVLQLWAEARVRFERGEKWWDVDTKLAEVEMDARYDEHPWFNPIAEYVGRRPHEQHQIYDLMGTVLELETRFKDRKAQLVIAEILRKLGYERVVRRVDGVNAKVWVKALNSSLG